MTAKTNQTQATDITEDAHVVHPFIAKLDGMRDCLIDRLGKGELPFDVATSIEVPYEYLCAWMTRKDVAHAFKTITKATQIHVQMVLNQFHASVIGRLGQIALETESVGSFESVAAARMIDIARKACVDLLKFKTRVFDPPGSFRGRTNQQKIKRRSRWESVNSYQPGVDFEDEIDDSYELPAFNSENPLAPFDLLNSAPPSKEPPTSDAVLVALDWMGRKVEQDEMDDFDEFVGEFGEGWKEEGEVVRSQRDKTITPTLSHPRILERGQEDGGCTDRAPP